MGRSHRHDGDLPRREPERPLARAALRQNRDHALHAAQDGAVDDDGAVYLARLGLRAIIRELKIRLERCRCDGHRWMGVRNIGQVEALRQLEVQLDGGALVSAADGVADRNVDFGPVEGAVARVQLPRLPEFLQALLQALSVWFCVGVN